MRGSRFVVVLSLLITSVSAWGQQDFTITYNTELGEAGSKTITLTMYDGAYDVDINNDGIYSDSDYAETPLFLDNLTGTTTITFREPGIYTIRIRPGISNAGNRLRMTNSGSKDAQKLIRVDNWGTSINWTSMRSAFSGCTNVRIPTSAGSPNLSGVTDMSFMFTGNTFFNDDISAWNTATITNMTATFLGATSFNQDIGSWNTSNVTKMNAMFSGAIAFNQDISGWNVSNVSSMNAMFGNATSFSQQNYDKLLLGWSSIPLQYQVTFGAPPVAYCQGEEGVLILTNELNEWTITNNQGKSCHQTSVHIKVCLHGAHDEDTKMMRASLGVAHLPTTTPYSDGATTNATVFGSTGKDAIVDWVFVELRDKNDITKVVHSLSGLLQCDGDIVGMDGVSTLEIATYADDYYIAVKHRNHIAIATNTVVDLRNTPNTIDLTVSTNVRGGAAFMTQVDTGMHAMLAGDANGDGQIQALDFSLLLNNFGIQGYRGSDVNLNGQTQSSEMDMLLGNIGKGVQF